MIDLIISPQSKMMERKLIIFPKNLRKEGQPSIKTDNEGAGKRGIAVPDSLANRKDKKKPAGKNRSQLMVPDRKYIPLSSFVASM